MGAGSGQRDCQRLRDLAAHGDDDADVNFLAVVDVHHAFLGELLEVKRVALVVVRRHRLRVAVDHDAAHARGTQRPHGRDGAPVELDARADAVRARPQHQSAARRGQAVGARDDVVVVAVVRHVQVVGRRGELGRERVDLLDARDDAGGDARRAQGARRRARALGELGVGEAELLAAQEPLLVADVGGDLLRKLGHVLQAREPPAVDLREVGDGSNAPLLVAARAAVEGLCDGPDAAVRGVGHLVSELVVGRVQRCRRLEARVARVDHAHGLLERLLKGAPDGHDFTNTRHGRAQVASHVLELAKVPARELGHHIV
mmetsp:Transcript_32315/g.108871  ORF Transcript_32315/g.108871 Transcript_32315/m.108871 type:complete len:316 (+) Transcript_32315:857-1804(+)